VESNAEESNAEDGTPDCTAARDLVSAAADDELTLSERRRLDLHLEGCDACRSYADRLAVLNRSVRLRAVQPRAELVGRVMALSGPARLGRGGWLRPALAWCGVVIAAQSVRPLVFADLDGAPTHVARHVGASALALAIGLIYAAWRPNRAFGLLPLVGALLATTVIGSVLDAIDGNRSPMAEWVHVAEFVGITLLWLVAGSPGWDRVRAAWRSFKPGGGVAGSTS
jgi:predicted anti-sigma-YlaC factor YlaD